MERPKVFISYSWDSEEHKEWVLKLSYDLIDRFGVDVLLDQYELAAGKELTYFMESSIEQSTKVLIILTPNYKLKAEKRTGGVGYEYSMISQELFEIQGDNEKFIPILRKGNSNSSSPKYIQSKIYFSMDDDSRYLNQLFELARIIFNKPKLVKPIRGKLPDFDKMDYDPTLELANNISIQEEINNKLNIILNSEKGIDIVNSEVDYLFKSINDKAELYKSKSQFHFNIQTEYRRNLILSCNGYSILIRWEQYYNNSLSKSRLNISYWKGYLELNSYNSMYYPGKEPEKIKEIEYVFDLNLKSENVWRRKDKSQTKSDTIVTESFSYIISEIQKEKSKSFRKE